MVGHRGWYDAREGRHVKGAKGVVHVKLQSWEGYIGVVWVEKQVLCFCAGQAGVGRGREVEEYLCVHDMKD